MIHGTRTIKIGSGRVLKVGFEDGKKRSKEFGTGKDNKHNFNRFWRDQTKEQQVFHQEDSRPEKRFSVHNPKNGALQKVDILSTMRFRKLTIPKTQLSNLRCFSNLDRTPTRTTHLCTYS